jgi:hypothetical protein
MPTLFRLTFVIGVAVALVYGAMLAVVTLVKPQPHEIGQAIALPQAAVAAETRTGRSVAETLNRQAAALVHHDGHRHREQF